MADRILTAAASAGGTRPARFLSALLPPGLGAEDRIYVRDILVLGGLLFAVTGAIHLATISWDHPIPRDNTTLALGRDFLNFWMYGRAAVTADPGRFYDPALYNAALQAVGGADIPGQNWSYPPTVMLLAAPFGQLPYLAALMLWTVLGVALFARVASGHVADWRVLLPVMISPAAMFCLISGQSAFVTGAMLIAIFAWLDRRPMAAGVLIGLLTIKPQLGLLFPFVLAASGRWRVFIAAAVTALALAGLAAALFGVQAWVDFVTKGLPVQNLVLADPNLIATPFYPTVFMNVRGLNLSYATAMTAQLMVSLPLLAAVTWSFHVARRRDADPDMLRALFLAASVGVSPYLLAYDVLPLTFAAVALVARGRLDATGRRLAQLVFWLPALQLALGFLHVPGPGLIAPAFAAYLAMRLSRAPAVSMA